MNITDHLIIASSPTVEVFRTTVQRTGDAETLVALLLRRFPDCAVNFDLEDCDHILRVEGAAFTADAVAALVRAHGFECSVLE